eukprot:1294813-Pyramimonas_sp.AAC.1
MACAAGGPMAPWLAATLDQLGPAVPAGASATAAAALPEQVPQRAAAGPPWTAPIEGGELDRSDRGAGDGGHSMQERGAQTA